LSAALSNLPATVPAGRSIITSLGVGHFGGENAGALGVAARVTDKGSDSDVFINLGGATTYQGEYMGRAGVSLAW
ncbi:MAG: YadA C-terminal domain-containing protein, partial [Bacteroidota bacterium]